MTVMTRHELSWTVMNIHEHSWAVMNRINTNCPLQLEGLVAMRYIELPHVCLNPKKVSSPCKPIFLSLLLSNQKEIMKRGMTWTEQKTKGTTFKVQSLAIANPWYIDLIHQCVTNCHKLSWIVMNYNELSWIIMT